MSVTVEVRDDETGAVLFRGAPIYDDPSQYVLIDRQAGRATVLRCIVGDLSQRLAVPAPASQPEGVTIRCSNGDRILKLYDDGNGGIQLAPLEGWEATDPNHWYCPNCVAGRPAPADQGEKP